MQTLTTFPNLLSSKTSLKMVSNFKWYIIAIHHIFGYIITVKAIHNTVNFHLVTQFIVTVKINPKGTKSKGNSIELKIIDRGNSRHYVKIIVQLKISFSCTDDVTIYYVSTYIFITCYAVKEYVVRKLAGPKFSGMYKTSRGGRSSLLTKDEYSASSSPQCYLWYSLI